MKEGVNGAAVMVILWGRLASSLSLLSIPLSPSLCCLFPPALQAGPAHPPDAASPTAPVGATHSVGSVVWRPVEEGRTPFWPVLSSLTSAWNVLEAASRGQ